METSAEIPPEATPETAKPRRLHVILPLTARQRAAIADSAEANGLSLTMEIKRAVLRQLSYEARVAAREDFAIARRTLRKLKASGGLTDEKLEVEARRVLEEHPDWRRNRLGFELARYEAQVTKGPVDLDQCLRVAESVLADRSPNDGGERPGTDSDPANEPKDVHRWAAHLLEAIPGISDSGLAHRLGNRFGLREEEALRIVAEARGASGGGEA